MVRTIVAATLLGGLVALGGCALSPEQEATLPHTYLEHALQAVQAHDKATALREIDAAENSWSQRNAAYTLPTLPFPPPIVSDFGSARLSVEREQWGQAEYYIRAALTHPSTLTPG